MNRPWNLSLFFVTVLLPVVCRAFPLPGSHARRHRLFAVSVQEGTTTQEESARLRKAKRLLEQFTDGNSDTTTVVVGGVPDNSTTEVPDNLWKNGLLDGGDIVTRYAFRRGVKIAEPLVTYDPVAAEKLLFTILIEYN